VGGRWGCFYTPPWGGCVFPPGYWGHPAGFPPAVCFTPRRVVEPPSFGALFFFRPVFSPPLGERRDLSFWGPPTLGPRVVCFPPGPTPSCLSGGPSFRPPYKWRPENLPLGGGDKLPQLGSKGPFLKGGPTKRGFLLGGKKIGGVYFLPPGKEYTPVVPPFFVRHPLGCAKKVVVVLFREDLPEILCLICWRV